MDSGVVQSIFVAEDDPNDDLLLRTAVKRSGHRVGLSIYRDGYALLEALHAAEELPSLVIVDLKMPRMGGIETIERIRVNPRLGSLPVIVLSTSDERSDVSKAVMAGANSYLRKCVDFDEFIHVVRMALDYCCL